jgi:hypothetical protein
MCHTMSHHTEKCQESLLRICSYFKKICCVTLPSWPQITGPKMGIYLKSQQIIWIIKSLLKSQQPIIKIDIHPWTQKDSFSQAL